MLSEYKYLGVIFDEFLNFNKCSKTLADAGGRALGALWSKFKGMKDIGFNTYTKLYNSGVVSVLDYGSGIWGFNKENHSESIQNKAIRYFLGVHNFTAIPAIQGEMGWLPSKYRKYLCMLRFWNRLVKMSPDRLTRQVFIAEYNSSNHNWSKEIKNILSTLDMMHIYENKLCCNISSCEEKLLLLAEDKWKLDTSRKPKLRTYTKFKNSFKTESYISKLVYKPDRSIVAKLRCGILQLHVETGRFTQTILENRLCNICNNNTIEDEFHFVCICPEYHNDRQKMYDFMVSREQGFLTMTDEEKFIYTVNSGSKALSRYLHCAWQKRMNILYNNR